LAVAGQFRKHLLGLAQADLFVRDGKPIRVDDFFAIDNRIANPSFESGLEGWGVQGQIESVLTDSGASLARVGPHSSLSQKLSAEPFCDAIFQCRVRAASSTASSAFEVVYYGPIGAPVMREIANREVGSEWTDLSLRTAISATATWGEVTIRATGPRALHVDAFEHACLSTAYRTFSPNDDGIYDDLPIGAWLNRDATVSISVLDSKDRVVKNLFQGPLEGQTYWEGRWDGSTDGRQSTPSGDYELLLEVQQEDGAPYSLPRRISVAREPAAATGTPLLHLDFYPRGFWMNVHDCYGGAEAQASAAEVEAEYDRLFARMRDCHGNVAVPAILDLQYGAVRRAAEEHEVYQIPSLYEPEMRLRYADPLEEQVIWDGYREALAPWRGSPYFFGTYPMDEPTSRSLDRTRIATKILSTLAPEVPPFFSLADPMFLGNFLDKIEPPSVLFHVYPCLEGEREFDCEAFIRNLEQARGEAMDRGLPYWAVLQTFSEPGRHRMPAPAEFRAMAGVALALGSKGVFSFLFNSSRWSGVEGLLGRDFEPTELLHEVAGVYGWIASNEALLLNLQIAQDLVKVEPPAYARTHVDKDGGVYFFVANTDPNAAIVAELVSVGSSNDRDKEVWKKIELGPGEFVLLKADGYRLDQPGLPDLERNPMDTLISKFKSGAKSVLEPVAGDFDWKQVGTIYGDD
jgi:hypothetical protein